MRPHVLELTAFGAFPGEVEIDFDRLGTGGLVLLCGETGGGKTTLLDALGFALYGVVPGLRGVRDLKSHHAAPDAAPRVRLEYSVPRGRFQVTRSPSWDRPKKRGDGTTRLNPTALLEQWNGTGWEAIATRPDDVGHEIGLHLGMSPDQFFQVVMLPQGRFADFLHADNDAREELLKQLFSVGLFERIEQWLAEKAKRVYEDLDETQRQLAEIRAKVTEAAGPALTGDDPPPTAGQAARADWADGLADAARSLAATSAARRDEAARARELAEQLLAETRQRARRAEEHAQLTARLADLDTEAPVIAALVAALDAAARANPVVLAVTAASRRADEAGAARAAEATARATLEAAAVPGTDLHAAPEADAGTLDQLAAAAHVESGRLDRLRDVLATARDDETAAAAADGQALAHAQAATARETELTTTLPAAKKDAQTRFDAARQAGLLAPVLSDWSAQLADLAAAVRERADAVTGAASARQAATAARTRATELRQQRFDAITAELAAALVDGTPCPVCGALDHPDPTEVRADHISKDEEQAADDEATRLEAAATDASGTVTALTERVTALRAAVLRPAGAFADADAAATDQVDALLADVRATLLDDLTLLPADESGGAAARAAADEFDTVSRACATAARTAKKSAKDLATAQTGLAELADKEITAHAELATARAGHREAGIRAAEARERARRALDTVPADLRAPESLASRQSAVTAFAAACESTRQAVVAAARAQLETDRAEAEAAAAASAAGFGTPAAALDAARDADWVTSSQARVTAHRDDRIRVAGRLADPDLAAAAAAGPVPLDEHEQAAAAARAAHEQAFADAVTATERAERLAALAAEYASVHAALAPREGAARELRGLADLAAGRGANQHGMPLSSYVLAARLEEVAQVASQRLSVMSGGRYTLAHDTGERRDRRRRAGLGLVVEDAWTGRSRATATLSGGETFQAALALALGLADVVGAEAGGHRIDALFVDEGFGTLDPDSLDEVMNVLDALRSGGRLVGVVSHVADLRQRIPAQIQVRKGPNGSTVEVSAG